MNNRLEVHVPLRLAIEHDGIEEVRAGAFASHDEAVKVLDYWRTLGYTCPMGIRTLPVWGTADEWIAAGATPASGMAEDEHTPGFPEVRGIAVG